MSILTTVIRTVLGVKGLDVNGVGATECRNPANRPRRIAFHPIFCILFSLTALICASGAARAGQISGSVDIAPSSVDLSAEGSADWIHWGRGGVPGIDRKAGVPAQISNFSALGGYTPSARNVLDSTYTWSDGTPLASSSSRAGLRVYNIDRGFSLTLPATTQLQNALLYLGAGQATGQLTATLSDGSAAPFVTQVVQGAGRQSFAVSLMFAADTAASELTIEYRVTAKTATSGSFISLEAAALIGDLPDQAPTIEPLPDQVVIEGSTLSLDVVASDFDGPDPLVLTQTNSLPQAPAILTDLGAGSGQISYTPNTGDAGSYSVTVTATAGNGVSTDTSFNVLVLAPGTQSELTAASDLAGSLIDLTLEGANDWIHWGRVNTSEFDRKANVAPVLATFEPIAGPAGAGVVRGSVFARYEWNDGATLAAANTRTGVRTSGFGAQGFELDVPADALSRTLKLYIGVKKGSGLLTIDLGGTTAPQVLEISQPLGRRSFVATIVFSSPIAGQDLSVSWQVESVAGDGWISLESAALSGAAVNSAPSIQPLDDQSVIEGQLLSFDVSATDADGPTPLTLSSTNTLPGDPDVFSDTGAGQGSVSWTPNLGDSQLSPYSITVTAADGGGRTSSESLSVTVLPDLGGENQPPSIAEIASQNVTENTLLQLALSASDSDGPAPLVLSQTNTVPDPENVLLTDNGDGTGAFAWAPPLGSSGKYSATIAAFDGELSAETSFQINVLPPSEGGLLIGSARVADAVVNLTEIGEADWVHWGLNGVETALDRKALVTPQISDFAAIGNAEPSANNTAMVSRYEWSDGAPTTTASTRSGLRAFDEGRGYQITIPATGDARRLKLFVGANTATARLTATLSDGSADPYVFDVVQPVGKQSREITLDFAAATPGAVLNITYVVIDRSGTGWASLESAALVAGNAPPVISPIDDIATRPETPISIVVQVADPDGPIEELIVSAVDTFGGTASFAGNGDGSWLWSYTPTTSEIGEYEVTFTAVDAFGGSSSLSALVDITLSERPEIISVAAQSVVEGEQLSVNLLAADTDGPTPLTFTQQNDLPGNPAVLTPGLEGEAVFSWAANVGSAADSPYEVTVVVTDGGATSAEMSFSVVVAENEVPQLQLAPSGTTALSEGQTLAVLVTAVDPDQTGTLSVSQSNTLPGAVPTFGQISDSTWEFLWTSAPGDSGPENFDVTITATDGLGGTVSQSVSVSVLPNMAPVIGVTGPLVLKAGDAFELDLQISDPDGPVPLAISETNTLPGSPTVTVDSNGVFRFTPGIDDYLASPYSLVVTATDGLMQTLQRTFVVEVVDNLLPTLSVSGDTEREEWQSLDLLVTAADSDGSIVDVSATTTLPNAELALTDNSDGTWGLLAAIDTGAANASQSVTLTATDDDGGVTTLVVPLTIAPRSLPNIVVILTDDQGLGDVSYEGFASDLQTTALDELAADGMRFNNFYANSSVCSPTRASLLTGRYPALVGVSGTVARDPETNMGQFTPNGDTLPEFLQTLGYATALVGKWHLGDKVVDTSNLPNARGFDEFRGFLGSALDYYTHDGSKFAWPGDDLIMINDQVVPPSEHVGIHTTDLFTPWAVDYIDEQTANQTQPFFLEVAYTAPHDPVQPPPEYLAAVQAREPGLSEERANLVALLEHMDASIGTIVQKLKDAGVYENTLIVYTSDNGGYTRFAANNGPYRGGKLDMYEGGIRVPAVVSWPGRIAKGSQTDDIALTMDLYPTIAEIVNAEIQQTIDGRSVVPTLRGQSPTYAPRDLVFENRSTLKDTRWKMIYALRRDDWKLVQDEPGGSFELYNLQSDPFETTDLAAAEPQIFADLTAALDAHIAQSDQVPWYRDLVFEQGTALGVTDTWQSVPLSQPYRDPIIVATPVYDEAGLPGVPLVTRVQGVIQPGVESTAFDLRVQRADGGVGVTTPVAVNYMVFEAGVYNEAHHGIKLEALPFDPRGRTSAKNKWTLPTQPLANDYEAPVVIGQVLTQYDEDFSVFWARGATRIAKPATSYFAPGLHVAEDPDTTRTDEMIGYVVLETGRALLNGSTLRAKVGPNSVEGVGDAPPSLYDPGDLVVSENVVLSSAGMRNNDGGWPVLIGPEAVTAQGLRLAQDEDQIGDNERSAAGGQVAYVQFGNSRPEILGLPGTAAVIIGEALSLPFTVDDLDDPVGLSITLASDAPELDEPSLALDGAAGTIEWTPQMGSAGAYNLTLMADDGRGGSSEVVVTVTVTDPAL